jgi:hypothetical protein
MEVQMLDLDDLKFELAAALLSIEEVSSRLRLLEKRIEDLNHELCDLRGELAQAEAKDKAIADD